MFCSPVVSIPHWSKSAPVWLVNLVVLDYVHVFLVLNFLFKSVKFSAQNSIKDIWNREVFSVHLTDITNGCFTKPQYFCWLLLGILFIRKIICSANSAYWIALIHLPIFLLVWMFIVQTVRQNSVYKNILVSLFMFKNCLLQYNKIMLVY